MPLLTILEIKMDELLQLPCTDIDTLGTNINFSTPGFDNQTNQTNLVKHARLLSIYAQIFEFQQTGYAVELHLPLVNADNIPTVAFRVNPLIPSLNTILSHIVSGNGQIYQNLGVPFFSDNCFISVPMAKRDLANDDRSDIGTGISIINNDDEPLISMLASQHMGWTGTLIFLFKIISNVTTQGKLAFSRIYHQERVAGFYDIFSKRKPINALMSSQKSRRDNAFIIVDASRQEDIEIVAPFVHEYSWFSTCEALRISLNSTNPTTGYDASVHDSFIMLDVIGTLAQSAAATNLLIEVQVKAGEDFQFTGRIPFGATRGFFSANSFISDGRPVVQGQGTGWRATGPNTIVAI